MLVEYQQYCKAVSLLLIEFDRRHLIHSECNKVSITIPLNNDRDLNCAILVTNRIHILYISSVRIMLE